MISLVNLERARPGFTTNLTGSTVEWMQYDPTSENRLARILEEVGKSVWLKGPAHRRAPPRGHFDNSFASRSQVLSVLQDSVLDILTASCKLVIDLFDYVGNHKDRDGNNIYLLNLPTAVTRQTDHGRFVYWYQVTTTLARPPGAKARRRRKA